MPNSCSAIGCTKRRDKVHKGISFFHYPDIVKEPELLTKWVEAVNRKGLNTQLRHVVLCEKHFHPSCIQNNGNRKFLVRGAVPTIFEPFGSKTDNRGLHMSKLKTMAAQTYPRDTSTSKSNLITEGQPLPLPNQLSQGSSKYLKLKPLPMLKMNSENVATPSHSDETDPLALSIKEEDSFMEDLESKEELLIPIQPLRTIGKKILPASSSSAILLNDQSKFVCSSTQMSEPSDEISGEEEAMSAESDEISGDEGISEESDEISGDEGISEESDETSDEESPPPIYVTHTGTQTNWIEKKSIGTLTHKMKTRSFGTQTLAKNSKETECKCDCHISNGKKLIGPKSKVLSQNLKKKIGPKSKMLSTHPEKKKIGPKSKMLSHHSEINRQTQNPDESANEESESDESDESSLSSHSSESDESGSSEEIFSYNGSEEQDIPNYNNVNKEKLYLASSLSDVGSSSE